MENLTKNQDKQLAQIINELQKIRVLKNNISEKSIELNKTNDKLTKLANEIFSILIDKQ